MGHIRSSYVPTGRPLPPRVSVTTMGTAFLHGGSSTTTATLGGRQVTLEWQESSQNFVITGVQAGGYYLQTNVTRTGRQ